MKYNTLLILKQYLIFFFISSFTGLYAQELPILTNYGDGRVYTTVAIDADNNVWAGTYKEGIFFLDQKKESSNFNFLNFSEKSNISKLRINSMAGDALGNIWVAHSGIDGNLNVYGGAEKINSRSLSVQHLAPDQDAKGFPYMERDGIGSRNTQKVIVDQDNRVWFTHYFHTMASELNSVTPGTFSYRKVADNGRFNSIGTWRDHREGRQDPILHYPAYTEKVPIEKTAGMRNVLGITMNNEYIYVSVDGYEIAVIEGGNDIDKMMPPRILKYNYEDLSAVAHYGMSNLSFTKGVIYGLHTNAKNVVWATNSLINGGFSVFTISEKGEETWYYFNPSIAFAKDIRFNKNAIWEDPTGRVFLGTNKGLLVYDGINLPQSPYSYTFYTNGTCEEGKRCIELPEMLADNISYGVSEKHDEVDSLSISWISTDKGIIRWEFPLIQAYHILEKNQPELDFTEEGSIKNYLPLAEMKHMKFKESNLEIPTFAADETTSSLFRYRTTDFKGFYPGFWGNEKYSFEVRKDENVPPKEKIGSDEYKNRYGEFTIKKEKNYPGGANQKYVDIVYKHPRYINSTDLVEGTNYAEYTLLVWDKSDKRNPKLIFKHPIRFSLPPTLLVHGVFTNKSTLDNLYNYLTDDFYRVHAKIETKSCIVLPIY